MQISEFGVEIWMNEFENRCDLNLAETCVQSLSLEQLLGLAGKNEDGLTDLLQMKMTYGAIEGSDRLRDNICRLYANQKRENTVVTHGTIGANALLYQTLVSPGDHVVAVLPSYQQHYSIPESLGADVSILRLREENRFLPDLAELRGLVRPTTRLISLTNPNNPTGALIGPEMLQQIVDIARDCGAYILSDEVYRGTDQLGDGFGVSIADLYEKGISTSGMSKVFSLAGLRLGWIAAPREVIRAVSIHRDYNTISVSIIDDYFATIALDCRDKIIARGLDITRTNLAILDAWVTQEPRISYVKPDSATVALLKYDFDMQSREFCTGLLENTGVMLTPGSALDMEGYVRIGYANATDVLTRGLARISGYLAKMER